MQRVKILNSGKFGATIRGTAGFGRWETVADSASGVLSHVGSAPVRLVRDAHSVQLDQVALDMSHVRTSAVLRYRQRLGPVMPVPADKVVVVTVLFEFKVPRSRKIAKGQAVLVCR